jgi:hypothetical protein
MKNIRYTIISCNLSNCYDDFRQNRQTFTIDESLALLEKINILALKKFIFSTPSKYDLCIDIVRIFQKVFVKEYAMNHTKLSHTKLKHCNNISKKLKSVLEEEISKRIKTIDEEECQICYKTETRFVSCSQCIYSWCIGCAEKISKSGPHNCPFCRQRQVVTPTCIPCKMKSKRKCSLIH